jgi:hypothetical protein
MLLTYRPIFMSVTNKGISFSSRNPVLLKAANLNISSKLSNLYSHYISNYNSPQNADVMIMEFGYDLVIININNQT